MAVVVVPGIGPGDVAVGVVLQFEGGCLCVSLCFEEGAPGLRALGECCGEEGGERVREEGVDFGGVQHWLVGGTVVWVTPELQREKGGMDCYHEGVVEDEYDYALCVS
jgi:hypothetical protein